MKPRIFLLVDVKGWAWWWKAHQLKKYLSNEFDFIIMLEADMRRRPQREDFELFVAFSVTQIHYFKHIPARKKLVNVTAVRPNEQIKDKCLSAGAVCTNSMQLFNQVKEFHPKVFYCPNGVDHNFFFPKPRLENAPLKFSYVGKYVPEKHLDDIIRPACEACNAELVAHTKDYRDADPPEVMRDHYRDIDVHIAASTIDGTPNPCLEAAACGRAIISNYIGNMPEFIVNHFNGFLVDLDVEQYVDRIKFFQKFPAMAAMMGRNARATVEVDWTWGKRAKNYRMMFNEILG